MRKLTTTMKALMLVAAFIWPAMGAMAQVTIWSLDFESTGGYTTSTPEFSDGFNDYFLRTDGSDINTSVEFTNIQGSYYFAAMDIDGEGATLPVTITIDDVDISGYNSLAFRVYLAEDDDAANQDWDDTDYLHFTFDIDNSGTPTNLLWVENDGTATNGAPLIDTDFDGTGDGAEITSAFTQHTVSIAGTGSLIDIVIEMSLNSGDEDIAIDHLELVGEIANPVGEPTNHVLSFAAAEDGAGSITLTWADNDGAQPADAFLIKASTSTITAPTDTNPEMDDTDLSDGSGAINVAHGVQTYTFTGLAENTQYNFEIYSYTNGGSTIDFKTDGTIPSASATTLNGTLTWYNLQWPGTGEITEGDAFTVYAQVYEDGVTNADGSNPGAGIEAWIGYSTENTDPSTWTNWVVATYDSDQNTNNDQFSADLGAVLPAGQYYYASRFQYNGGEYMYGGFVENAGGPWDGTTNVSGVLSVKNAPVALPYSETFDADLGNMYTYSVLGDTKEWNQSGGTANMNGFNSGETEEDWMIFPPVDLTAQTNEVITFDAYWNFGSADANNYFKLMYSTDYAGVGDPSSATWTELTFNIPPQDTWASSGIVDIDAINEANVYFAFKYHYEAGSYQGWEVDNVVIEEMLSPVITNISRTPVLVKPTDAVSVTADITDANGTISSVTLNWGTATNALGNPINMSVSSGNTYITDSDIPVQVDGTTVFYEIIAEDNDANVTITDEMSYDVMAVTEVADIATLRGGATDGTIYQLTGEAILTYQQSYRGQKYIQDGTGGILIDDNAGTITTSYNLNDGITGIAGELSEFSGMLQFVPVIDPGAASSSGLALTPEVAAIADINATIENYESELITLENVTFVEAGQTFGNGTTYTLSDGTNSINFTANFYNVDYIGEVIPSGLQTITAIVMDDNGTAEVTAREAADIVSTHPVISNISMTPAMPSSSDVITISADVTNDVGAITSVNLNYGTATGDLGTTVAMTASGDTYSGDIPVQADGTTIYYQIVATNENTNETTTDEMSFEVRDYLDATQLSITSVTPASPTVYQAFDVEVTALDANSDVGIVTEDTEVTLSLSTGNGALGGTVTGTILSGTTSIVVSGVTYDMAETINLKATVATGMVLTASADYEVIVADIPTVALPFTEGFDTDLGQMTGYSVTGDQVWEQDVYSGTTYAKMTGFVNPDRFENEDWLITPGLDFSGVTNAYMSFTEAINFAGTVADEAKVFASTDYNGTGDPSAATWIELAVTGRSTGGSWTFVTVDAYDLSAYAGESSLFIAFAYYSTTTEAGTWEIDEINIQEGVPQYSPEITNVTLSPAQPSSSDAVSISATITDIDGTIDSAILHWGNLAFYGNEIKMSLDTDNTWVTDSEIPAQDANTLTFYKIVAYDNDLNEVETDPLTYSVYDPYAGTLPFYEPFHFDLGVMDSASIIGDNTWYWSEYNSDGYATASGYSGGAVANEDYLITPMLDLSQVSSAALNFREAINLRGNAGIVADDVHQVFVSTDYTDDVATATWTELTITGRNPIENDFTWVDVDEVSLDDYAGESSVYIAFKYQSTDAANSTWQLDNISVTAGVGIANAKVNNLSIYPNPAQNTVFVSGVENISNVEIISLDGKVVMNEQTNNNRIDVSSVNNGMYIMRVISGNEVYTTRFVKQ